jgi:murein L,D-transpeptidase YcbB/YkuD
VAGFFSGSSLLGLQRGRVDAPAVLDPGQAEQVQHAVQGAARELRRNGEPGLADLLETFYLDRGYRLAWADPQSLTAARDLLVRVASSHEDGLCPMRYNVPALRDRTAVDRPFAADHAATLDVDLSTALLRYALHLGLGHPASDDRASSARSLDVLSTFHAMRRPETVQAAVAALGSPHPEYWQLRRALATLRAAVLRGGWPSLPADLFLRPNDTAAFASLLALAERLQLGGDLTRAWPGDEQPNVYAGALVEGVRRFQTRHGLVVDGIVGPRTVAALNVPASARLEQIETNMDRWRRVPDDLGRRHVRVNIPEFRVRVFQDGMAILGMRAIVGRPATQTPVFSDRIRYLVFHPYWNVPDSIVRNEIAPAAADDPSYVAEQNFEVLSGWEDDAELIDPASVDWEAERLGLRIRQRPGPENALGRVKFMFPNRYSVYLHDTPATWLFDRSQRALSHGCVRVAHPESLAETLLADTGGWEAEQVAQAMTAGERVTVALDAPVPVHLLYFTAWADAAGAIHFRDDVYGRDEAARAWLGCRPHPGRSP